MRSASESLRWSVVTLLSLPLTTLASFNDWSKACTNGQCFYDLPAHEGPASGTLKIWGSPDAISDITEAAGWTILGCDPNALEQDVRLVCTSPSGCNHLYSKNGAVNKIVRIPENCGKNAFARIANESDSEDQEIPQEVAKKFAGQRGTSMSKVKTLRLDSDFAKVDAKESGTVYVALFGTTLPNVGHNVPAFPSSSGALKKGLWDWANNLDSKDFNVSFGGNLPAIDISHDWPLLSESVDCDGVTASITADAQVSAHAETAFGITASGTLVPPHLDDFGLFIGINTASVDGTVHLKANATGSIDTVVTLYDLALPSIKFHGILTVSPIFIILSTINGTVDLNSDLKIDLSYTAKDVKIFLPPEDAPASGGTFLPNGNLQLSVDPGALGNTNLTTHIAQAINLNLNALNVAFADISLELDTTANLDVDLVPPPSSSSAVSGCVHSDANLDVFIRIVATIIGLLNPHALITLYNRDFPLVNKCFGGVVSRELALDSEYTPVPTHQLERRLACHQSTSTSLMPIV